MDNPNVPRLAQHGYTLKVTNSLDSREKDVVEGQNTLLAFLGKCAVLVRKIEGKECVV